jgi:hypothetical protein
VVGAVVVVAVAVAAVVRKAVAVVDAVVRDALVGVAVAVVAAVVRDALVGVAVAVVVAVGKLRLIMKRPNESLRRLDDTTRLYINVCSDNIKITIV